MLEFNKKKKLRKVLYSPFVLIVLSIVFVLLLRGVWGVYNKSKFSAENLLKDQGELSRLIEREKSLAASLDYLKTEQGIESEIRSKFRAVKDDEKLAVIIEDEKPVPASTTSSEKRGFWHKVYAIMFGL